MNAAAASTRRRISSFLLAAFWLACAGAARAEEVDVFGTVASFTWKEFFEDDTRVLKESGTFLGLGVAYRREFPDQVSFNGSAEFFGGRVGYDGRTLDNNPLTTDVDYSGLNLKGDAGRFFSLRGPCSIEPFAGLGVRAWVRQIRNGVISSGSRAGLPAQGYTERWATLHARLGVRTGADISQTKRAFVEAGFKIPLFNVNNAGIGPDVTLYPGRQVSFFAEAGVRLIPSGEGSQIKGMRAGVFYDGLRFSRSADVGISGNRVAFQPRSTADIYGVNVGFLF